MIRIVAMLDDALVIGGSTEQVNRGRMDRLPPGLAPVMAQLYTTDNAAAGASSWDRGTSGARHLRFVITRDPAFDTGGTGVEVVTDLQTLIDRYATSDDELLITGGLSMFEAFTPHAQRIDLAWSHDLVPGDVVYDRWRAEPLIETGRVRHEGFDVVSLTRGA